MNIRYVKPIYEQEVECINCKSRLVIHPNDLNYSVSASMEYQDDIWYYTCPVCGRCIHFDNKEALERFMPLIKGSDKYGTQETKIMIKIKDKRTNVYSLNGYIVSL